jgi:hypothetical protein
MARQLAVFPHASETDIGNVYRYIWLTEAEENEIHARYKAWVTWDSTRQFIMGQITLVEKAISTLEEGIRCAMSEYQSQHASITPEARMSRSEDTAGLAARKKARLVELADLREKLTNHEVSLP